MKLAPGIKKQLDVDVAETSETDAFLDRHYARRERFEAMIYRLGENAGSAGDLKAERETLDRVRRHQRFLDRLENIAVWSGIVGFCLLAWIGIIGILRSALYP
jgi:hypothetical protein